MSEPATFPELVTVRTIREETGLPDSTIRAILQRAVGDGATRPIKTVRTVMFRRSEVAPYFTGDVDPTRGA